jgi:hypothetical protein
MVEVIGCQHVAIMSGCRRVEGCAACRRCSTLGYRLDKWLGRCPDSGGPVGAGRGAPVTVDVDVYVFTDGAVWVGGWWERQMGSVTSVVSVVTTGLDVRDSELELGFHKGFHLLRHDQGELLCLMFCCRCISWGHEPAVRDTAGCASLVSCETFQVSTIVYRRSDREGYERRVCTSAGRRVCVLCIVPRWKNMVLCFLW